MTFADSTLCTEERKIIINSWQNEVPNWNWVMEMVIVLKAEIVAVWMVSELVKILFAEKQGPEKQEETGPWKKLALHP